MAIRMNHKTQSPQQHRINERIRISPVRVVGADGDQLGVMDTDAAMTLAKEQGLDLVEIVPDQRPPICRLMDYGKFKYEQSKKVRKQRNSQADTKEVRLRPNTDTADMDRIVARANGFLEKGHRVQVTMMFRGRQMRNKDIGIRIMTEIAGRLEESGQVDKAPAAAGRRATMMMVPKPAKRQGA